MPTDSNDDANLTLPERPNLRHLKNQARDLLKSGGARSITDAQFKIARLYGFASWPKLKMHVESLAEIGQLKLAIDRNDLDRVKALMTRNPSLHRAPLGYGKSGPLTWAAECRIPSGAPTAERLAIARWMIENGSDIHQGGDGPLSRASLNGQRIAMMDLLVSCGANVNAEWNGSFPIIYSPCETVDPIALKWLLNHGADPNCADRSGRGTALDYLIESYSRSTRLGECIDILLNAGAKTKYDVPPLLDLLRGRLDRLAAHLQSDSSLAHRRFEQFTFGGTGGRLLDLNGATLLHVAAEFGNAVAATLLLEHGADVNAQALVDEHGVGGQTAIFHAVTQFGDFGLSVTKLLLEKGADLSLRVTLPGYYEKPGEVVECTPLGYALRFPGGESKTIMLLRGIGAPE
jgi:ankyrin repeat protein